MAVGASQVAVEECYGNYNRGGGGGGGGGGHLSRSTVLNEYIFSKTYSTTLYFIVHKYNDLVVLVSIG